MKKFSIVFALIIMMSSLALCLNPPVAVKKSFEVKFPGASKLKWGKESKTVFEVEFVLNGINMTANFSREGKWQETETQINTSDFPEPVKNSIDKNYKGWNILKAERTESENDGITYEALLKSGKHKKAVEFKSDGSLFKE